MVGPQSTKECGSEHESLSTLWINVWPRVTQKGQRWRDAWWSCTWNKTTGVCANNHCRWSRMWQGSIKNSLSLSQQPICKFWTHASRAWSHKFRTSDSQKTPKKATVPPSRQCETLLSWLRYCARLEISIVITSQFGIGDKIITPSKLILQKCFVKFECLKRATCVIEKLFHI